MEVQRTIRAYLIVNTLFCVSHSFIASSYMIFLLGAGLDQFQANLVNVVFYFGVVFFEIPTGVVADVFGRRISVLISIGLMMISFFLYGASDDMLGFMLAELIGAIALTFESGAFSAWVVDEIKGHGYEESTDKLFAREQVYTSFASIGGVLVGGVLFDLNRSYAWWCGGVLLFFTLIIACFLMKELHFDRKVSDILGKVNQSLEILKFSFKYLKKSREVRFLIVVGASLSLALQVPNMFWQPIFVGETSNSKGLSLIWVGVLLTIIAGGKLAPAFRKKLRSDRKAIIVLNIFIGIGIFVLICTNSLWIMLTGFLFHELARAMSAPLRTKYLHDNVPSKQRATLISFESLFRTLGGVVGLMIFGLIAELEGYTLPFLLSGAIVILISVVYFLKNGFNEKTTG
ncbi:MAG: MFS transporter [Candidatus Gracilibacteria bacterium]|jgi:MFS family permease|nr:MFS transporter [Candidatus Gracilibacteria bacterium]